LYGAKSTNLLPLQLYQLQQTSNVLETSYRNNFHTEINVDTLLHLVGYFCVNYTMMHRSTDIKFIDKQLQLVGYFCMYLYYDGQIQDHQVLETITALHNAPF
jgi:hypothetical protein